MKYCPQCGSEYRTHIERCPDCDEVLADAPPVLSDGPEPTFGFVERVEVFTTGRRIDAEMVRGMLETHGIDARIWAGGMGAYRLESALTEITGVPNAFNAYRVGVPAEDEESARALLADVEAGDIAVDDEREGPKQRGFLAAMRARWLLLAAAFFLLLLVILFGPPGVS